MAKKSDFHAVRKLRKLVSTVVNDYRAAQQEWIDAPKCEAEESAALTDAAMKAIAAIVNEIRDEPAGTELGKWKDAYSRLLKIYTGRSQFLSDYSDLTATLDSTSQGSLEVLLVREASEQALMAADESIGRKYRLSALHWAGMMTGGFGILRDPKAFSEQLQKEASSRSRRMTDSRYKDSRQDRRHVDNWATENASKHLHQKGPHKGKPNLDAIADEIKKTNQVKSPRATVRRWLTEWAKSLST